MRRLCKAQGVDGVSNRWSKKLACGGTLAYAAMRRICDEGGGGSERPGTQAHMNWWSYECRLSG